MPVLDVKGASFSAFNLSGKINLHDDKFQKLACRYMYIALTLLNACYLYPFQHGTASGAICKHVQKWVRTFSAEKLEFYALHYPKDPWMKLSDLCHFHPEKVCAFQYIFLIKVCDANLIILKVN